MCFFSSRADTLPVAPCLVVKKRRNIGQSAIPGVTRGQIRVPSLTEGTLWWRPTAWGPVNWVNKAIRRSEAMRKWQLGHAVARQLCVRLQVRFIQSFKMFIFLFYFRALIVGRWIKCQEVQDSKNLFKINQNYVLLFDFLILVKKILEYRYIRHLIPPQGNPLPEATI